MIEWFVANKELLKIFYGLVIGLICFFIVLKIDKLYRLSLHQGIRYFRNAFFFYGLAFLFRYIISLNSALNFFGNEYSFIARIVFEFFLIMAGFFLLYSLLWKRIESNDKTPISSLFNAKISVFYLMSLIIVIMDYLWGYYYFMFFSQIIIFIFAAAISWKNYLENGSRGKFLKFYFIAMVLAFFAWLLNALTALYFNWNQGILLGVYVLNIIMFCLFLYGVIKVTRG